MTETSTPIHHDIGETGRYVARQMVREQYRDHERYMVIDTDDGAFMGFGTWAFASDLVKRLEADFLAEEIEEVYAELYEGEHSPT